MTVQKSDTSCQTEQIRLPSFLLQIRLPEVKKEGSLEHIKLRESSTVSNNDTKQNCSVGMRVSAVVFKGKSVGRHSMFWNCAMRRQDRKSSIDAMPVTSKKKRQHSCAVCVCRSTQLATVGHELQSCFKPNTSARRLAAI